MKRRIIPILLAALFSVGLVSCQHQTMSTIEFTVRHSEWHQDNGLLAYTFYWPELTSDVVDFGTVNAYFIDRNGSQNMLPFVYKQMYHDDEGNYDYYVPENVTFYYGYGFLTITIEDLDDNTLPPASDNWGERMSFRLVAIGD